MERAYISTKVKADLDICKLRDSVFDDVDGMGYYKKSSPHITVVPPFLIEEDDIAELRTYVNNLSIVSKPVTINGLTVWQNITTPEVVMLDVDVDIEEARNKCIDKMEGLNVRMQSEPVPPHITLFKREDWWDDVPLSKKVALQDQIGNVDYPEKTAIREVNLVVS